jgi:hypothetical protein
VCIYSKVSILVGIHIVLLHRPWLLGPETAVPFFFFFLVDTKKIGRASSTLYTFFIDIIDEHVKEWDAERNKVIDQAFSQFLLPQLEKELRVKLLNEAREFVVRACCQQLNNRLKVSFILKQIFFIFH